jgi:hypothetical protein
LVKGVLHGVAADDSALAHRGTLRPPLIYQRFEVSRYPKLSATWSIAGLILAVWHVAVLPAARMWAVANEHTDLA